METAHGLGVESTATFMMGTGETDAERIEHLRMIRDVQDRTGGFRSFIPWTYQPENNHLKGRTQATVFDYLRLVAVARLFFDNIAHLQGSWLTTGKEAGQLTLHMGADDLGSVMLEENVVSSAGAEHRSNRQELIDLIRSAGRVPAQRDTLYQPPARPPRPGGRPGDPRGPLARQLDRPATDPRLTESNAFAVALGPAADATDAEGSPELGARRVRLGADRGRGEVQDQRRRRSRCSLLRSRSRSHWSACMW